MNIPHKGVIQHESSYDKSIVPSTVQGDTNEDVVVLAINFFNNGGQSATEVRI